jgi:segregation and condensation protein B
MADGLPSLHSSSPDGVTTEADHIMEDTPTIHETAESEPDRGRGPEETDSLPVLPDIAAEATTAERGYSGGDAAEEALPSAGENAAVESDDEQNSEAAIEAPADLEADDENADPIAAFAAVLIAAESEAEETDDATEETEDELAVSEEFEHDYKAVIEALIFASDEPLTFRQIKDVIIGPDEAVPAESETTDEAVAEDEAPIARGRRKKEAHPFTINLVRRCIDGLNTDYRQSGRSFRITEIAGGFAFQTSHEFGGYVGRLFAERSKRRLSQSALETLAIIAFKQPISKPVIEGIRGVNADFVLKSLLERNLIAIVGRDSTVGRPLLYGTTKTFLKHFGLKNLEDLPKPREIQELMAEERERDILLVDDVDGRKTAELHHTSDDGHLFDTIPADDEDAADAIETTYSAPLESNEPERLSDATISRGAGSQFDSEAFADTEAARLMGEDFTASSVNDQMVSGEITEQDLDTTD